MSNDELDKATFICMYCQKKFKATEGTWPQNTFEGEPMLDADLNNRSANEFVCYDCAE